jgi:hypothetical protein
MSAAGMDVRNVEAMSQPAIRAVLLCCGDCSGREIVIPVLYVIRSSGIPLASTRALPPAGSAPPVGRLDRVSLLLPHARREPVGRSHLSSISIASGATAQ